MNVHLWITVGVALSLTLAVEVAAALCMGVRQGKGFLVVGLVNLLTVPPAVLTYWYLHHLIPKLFPLFIQLPLAAGAWAAEGRIYKMFRRKKPYLFSLIANLASYAAGLIFEWLFW